MSKTIPLTLENVKTALTGLEPGRGGYGSDFEFEEYEGCIEVKLLAEWLPRYREPTRYIVAMEGNLSDKESIMVTWRFSAEPTGQNSELETDTLEVFADSLADSD